MDNGLFEAIIGIIASISAWFAYRAKHHSAKVNDAVNNVHVGKNGEKIKLYDMVLDNYHRSRSVEDKIQNTERHIAELVTWKRGHVLELDKRLTRIEERLEIPPQE